ncbi:MAG: S8 family serine peptidase [Pseudomonadota bacterium]
MEKIAGFIKIKSRVGILSLLMLFLIMCPNLGEAETIYTNNNPNAIRTTSMSMAPFGNLLGIGGSSWLSNPVSVSSARLFDPLAQMQMQIGVTPFNSVLGTSPFRTPMDLSTVGINLNGLERSSPMVISQSAPFYNAIDIQGNSLMLSLMQMSALPQVLRSSPMAISQSVPFYNAIDIQGNPLMLNMSTLPVVQAQKALIETEAQRNANANPYFKPDEALIVFRPNTSFQEIQAIHSTIENQMRIKTGNNNLMIRPNRLLGPSGYPCWPGAGTPMAPVIPRWPIISGGGCLIDRISTNANIFSVINEYMSQQPFVLKAELNYYAKPSAIPNDPDFYKQWNMVIDPAYINLVFPPLVVGADINAALAWDQTYLGVLLTPKTVAVVDTGVYTAHPDLAANMVPGWNLLTLSSIVDDPEGHGTAIAGIIGAVGNNGIGIAGVNWTAVRIMPIKALWSTSTNADAIMGVEYAILNGANIINCSWYIDLTATAVEILSLQAEIQKADLAGILVIVAAGNNATNLDLNPTTYYPQSYLDPNIICVAATSAQNQLGVLSNYGATMVDLAAPEGVYTTWSPIALTANGQLYYGQYGTSIAAPHVAGAAALIWAMFPNLRHLDVKAAIMNGVEPNLSLVGKTVTGGQLDVNNALNNARIISATLPPVL